MESGLSEYAGQSQNSIIQREASGTATGSRRELVEGIKKSKFDGMARILPDEDSDES